MRYISTLAMATHAIKMQPQGKNQLSQLPVSTLPCGIQEPPCALILTHSVLSYMSSLPIIVVSSFIKLCHY